MSITVADSNKIAVKAVGDLVQTVKTKRDINEILINKLLKNKIVATGDLINNMFKLNTVSSTSNSAYAAKGEDNIVLWHRRMGHLSLSGLKRLNNVADMDIPTLTKCSAINCITCAEGKHCRERFETSENCTNDLLELVHTDVCGMGVNSIGGAKYYVTIIDDFSRKNFIYIIKNKSQVFDVS